MTSAAPTTSTRPVVRFEVSWRPTASMVHEDDGGVRIAPWRSGDAPPALEEAAGFETFVASCRALGVEVHVGRSRGPNHARTIFVDSSGLASRRDDLLERLWETHRVDSFGGDDLYAGPVLFGVAAGIAIDRFADAYVRPKHGIPVVLCHGWTAGAALLEGAARAPDLGTVYVAHETVVGSAVGRESGDALVVLSTHGPEGIAADKGLRNRHSLETACVRAADAIVAVGDGVARELTTIHGRAIAPAGGPGDEKRALDAAIAEAARRAGERAAGAYVEASPAAVAAIAGLSPRARRHRLDIHRLASNLAWSWEPGASEALADIDPVAWAAGHENPIAAIVDAPAARWESLALDAAHCNKTTSALERLDTLVAGTPNAGGAAVALERPVAYFCAEFGLHASLPVYSGGLGILAGDHVKAASDRGLAFVGVGLFYRHGYVQQVVNEAGDQIPLAVDNDPRRMPMELLRGADGKPVKVSVALADTPVVLVAWRVRVGRVSVLLLDADIPDNRADLRTITARLYGGDAEARLRQELVLGVGGMRLLDRLGIRPSALHLNEGHAAFAPLEAASQLIRLEGLTFADAVTRVRASTVFTTHTPVPAGHDRFAPSLLKKTILDVPGWLSTSVENFLALGRVALQGDAFNMTWLALRMSSIHNGVSRLHGRVSRRLLGPAFPGVPEDEVPVTSITNGVHLPTWTAPEIVAALGVTGRAVAGADFASRAKSCNVAALWKARRALRRRLLERARVDLRRSALRRREVAERTATALDGLDETALLIGFARRFASYKRADLLLRDVTRLGALASKSNRPIRFFYAGKAHPNDEAGLNLVRRVVEATRTDALLGKVFFLEDYDAALARRLVEGVDVWLNTPLRGLEASGTSGMKAAANGALNVSVRDGWWDEAFDGTNGFAIGQGPEGAGHDEDAGDLQSTIALLEHEVAPLFFDRDAAGVPVRWLERVKASLATIPPVFDSVRMVAEYDALAYRPLARANPG